MEDCNNLTANDIIPGVGGVIDKGATGVKDVVINIRNKAKAKEAQKVADSGGYWTLRPFLKSLIPIPQYILDQVAGQGITEYAVKQLPEQSVGTSNTTILSALQKMSGTGTVAGSSVNPTGNIKYPGELQESNLQKYLPYIGGGLVVLILAYFIFKR